MRPFQNRFWLPGLLLPAILFRALIPVGFMPAVDSDGRLVVIFCPVSVIEGQGANQAQHHAHEGGNAGSAGSGHHQLVCPFAASAGPAPLPAVSAPVIAPADLLPPDGSASTRLFIPSIIRAQSPRVPPETA